MTMTVAPHVEVKSTVEASALLRGLSAIAPFAGVDGTRPVLNQVRLFGDGTRLTFVATNQFALGSLSVPYTGDTFESGLSLADAKALIPTLKRLRNLPVDLIAAHSNYGPEALTLKHHEGEVRTRPYPDFPKWRQLIPDASRGTSLDMIALDPKYLAIFAKVQVKNEPMRLHFSGRVKPIRVEIGENFIGLLMPVRYGD